MIVTFLKHLALILVAFLISSVVTGYVVNFSLLFHAGHTGDGARSDFFATGLFISFFVTYFAAGPAALTVAVGEYFSIRRWWYYALAGSAIGLGLGTMFRPPDFFPWLGLSFGIVSGLIFWAIAGRKAGPADHNGRVVAVAILSVITAILLVLTWASFFGAFF